MNPMSQIILLVVLLFGVVFGQKSLPVVKGSPELVEQSPYASDKEVINKVQQQLFNAMELLQAYEEDAPMKIAEKRRNKFEFIRFGRRR
uniref:Uncharacterized protein n=1 Tax=Acrobeloides nanus TaxID=290746 RepID=A0A914DTM4_9BILA